MARPSVAATRLRISACLSALAASNSSLVAPVEIGDGAYIGSGSVITKTVEADALALRLQLHNSKSHQSALPPGAQARKIFDAAEQAFEAALSQD